MSGYEKTGSGTNSQGNNYDTRSYPEGKAYHYSNQDSSYYYKNANDSKYYSAPDGSAKYTSPSGYEKTYTAEERKK